MHRIEVLYDLYRVSVLLIKICRMFFFFYFYTLNNSCFLNVFVVVLYYITTKMKDITYNETKRATMREGGGYGERGKACESGRLQVDVAAEVQSSERHASACLGSIIISQLLATNGHRHLSCTFLVFLIAVVKIYIYQLLTIIF